MSVVVSSSPNLGRGHPQLGLGRVRARFLLT